MQHTANKVSCHHSNFVTLWLTRSITPGQLNVEVSARSADNNEKMIHERSESICKLNNIVNATLIQHSFRVYKWATTDLKHERV
jgi:hypothetical protein